MGDGVRDVVVVIGSLRRDSWNRRVMEAGRALAPASLRLELVGIEGVPLFDEDIEHDPPPAVLSLRARLGAADGVVLSVPEYNLGLAGVAKNAIDWFSRPVLAGPLLDKPVAVVSVSTSRAEPERAAAQARLSAEVCGARLMPPPDLTIRSIARRVDDDGGLVDVVTTAVAEHLARFATFLDTSPAQEAIDA
jgi:chromate reductase